MRESEVEKYLDEQVRLLGGETRKIKWINHNGAPDRHVFFPWGEDFLVETKRPKNGKISKAQEREHKFLKSMGKDVIVIRSVDCVDLWLKDVLAESSSEQIDWEAVARVTRRARIGCLFSGGFLK